MTSKEEDMASQTYSAQDPPLVEHLPPLCQWDSTISTASMQ